MATESQILEILCRYVRQVHTTFYSTISDTVKDNMVKFTEELFSRSVISLSVKNSLNYTKVTDEFWAGLPWKKSVTDIELHCQAFLQSLVAIGPNGAQAAQCLRQSWTDKIQGEMNINFLSGKGTKWDETQQKQECYMYIHYSVL